MSYEDLIQKATQCTAEEAPMVEDILRNDIVHSTLDHLSATELSEGARQAYALFQEMRAEYEAFYAQYKP